MFLYKNILFHASTIIIIDVLLDLACMQEIRVIVHSARKFSLNIMIHFSQADIRYFFLFMVLYNVVLNASSVIVINGWRFSKLHIKLMLYYCGECCSCGFYCHHYDWAQDEGTAQCRCINSTAHFCTTHLMHAFLTIAFDFDFLLHHLYFHSTKIYFKKKSSTSTWNGLYSVTQLLLWTKRTVLSYHPI